jgi:flagellar biosynthesis GTPase FlhF
MTSLALIFTVGLGDTANPDGLSAYSVFNRGFQQLMGSVDVDSLLAQHVGGGLGAAGVGGGAMGMPRAAADDDHEPVPRAARRPLVRREPDNHHQEEEEEDRNEDEDDDDEEEEEAPNNNNNNNNRARKSGKKARRRNLDQRRDIRQQREAAMALGMQGGDGPEDQMAIQRLLEEQIAADNQNGNH